MTKPPTRAAKVRSGAQWTMHLGDCRDVLRAWSSQAPVVITDPPYGIDLGEPNAGRDNGGLLRTGHGRARAGHGIAHRAYRSYVDSYDNFVGTVVPALNTAIDIALRAAIFSGPHIHEQRKPDAIGGIHCPAATARGPWGFKSILPVLLYGKAPDLNRGSFPTAISSTETITEESAEHPVPKPIGWMLWLVRLASREGDVVLDPFAGSGTTGVAAMRLGRPFVGIEMDPEYFALACERLAAEEFGTSLQATRAGQTALFGKSGR